MSFLSVFKKICTPALLYLILSFISILIIIFSTIQNKPLYCLGEYNCGSSAIILFLITEIIFILFWTWVLNLICKAGYKSISWFLVLLPFIILFFFFFYIFYDSLNMNSSMNQPMQPIPQNLPNQPPPMPPIPPMPSNEPMPPMPSNEPMQEPILTPMIQNN
jgi:hypothetical protein